MLLQWWNMENHFSLETEQCSQLFLSSSVSLGDQRDQFHEISVGPWSGRIWVTVQPFEATVTGAGWDQLPPVSVQVYIWSRYWPDTQCWEMRMLSLPSQAHQSAGRLLWDHMCGCRYREFQTWLRSTLRPVLALAAWFQPHCAANAGILHVYALKGLRSSLS